MGKPLRKVFLSSTGRDLAEYREAVALAINRADGFHCVRMEDFGARAMDSDTFCQEKVAECDVYVGLLGHLYGGIPPGEKHSYTEREYDAAVQAGMPRLVFVATNDFKLPKELWKDAVAQSEQVERFHERVKKDLVVGHFSFGDGAPQELARSVTAALANLPSEGPKKKAVKRPKAAQAAPPDDLVATERTYLAFLADRYQYLDFKGMGVSGLSIRFPLLDLYVPLKARPALPEGEKGGGGDLRLAGRRMTEEERKEAGTPGGSVPVLDLLEKEPGLVLLGDPGAGKSTFLKVLALSLAAGRGGELGLAGRVPFLVPIAGYAEALSQANARLDHFIANDFRERVGDLAVGGLLESALAAGRALVLLDGLDEVRERSLQQKVVAGVQDFFSLHSQKGNKFVLTSRLVGYREVRPTAKGLVEATLVDFDYEEIEAFLARWVKVQERTVFGETQTAQSSAERQRRELSDSLQRNSAVRALAANPLLLTILTLMKRQGVTLPEQRAKLYDNYVRTLLESWNTVRSLRGVPVVERSAADLLKVLAPLALWIHATSPGLGQVRRKEMLGRVEAIYGEVRGVTDPEVARAAAEAFLRDLNDSCLLLERGNGLYGFIHLTFLEYLAGYALAKLDQQGTEILLAAISTKVGERSWREVLLLAIGHLGAVEEREVSAGAVLAGLVERKPGPAGEAEALAGQALADLGPTGAHPAVRKQVVDSLLLALRDDLRVPVQLRARVGEVLALVGDPRPEVMTLAGMEFCWVPPGSFVMGSGEKEVGSFASEKPQHELEIPYGYWVGRYPVTVAQFGEYLDLERKEAGHERVLAGPKSSPVVAVSWRESQAICLWLTKKGWSEGWLSEGWSVALPSEAEWEKAARGGLRLPVSPAFAGWDGLSVAEPRATGSNPSPTRRFPWGTESDPNRASYGETGIGRVSIVGCFPGGSSPLGCEELSGNVWEWTRNGYKSYPYVPTDGREVIEASENASVVLRGGSCFLDSNDVRCAYRLWSRPTDRSGSIGFRVVVRPFSSVP